MKSAATMRWLMQQGVAAFDPATLPGTIFFLESKSQRHTLANGASGSGAAITGAGPTFTLTAAGIVANHVGGTVVLAGYTNPANNGRRTILTAAAGSLTFSNPGGAAEAGGASKTWAIDGSISVATCALGNVFNQATFLNQWAWNTSMQPAGAAAGVWSTGTQSTKWMLNSNAALAGLLNGLVPHTMFIYWRPLSYPGTTTQPIIFRDGPIGSSFPNYATCRTGVLPTSSRQVARGNSVGGYVVGVSATQNVDQWHSLGFEYDGNITSEIFSEGVSIGSGTFGPARSLAGLSFITVGSNNQSNTPGAGTPMMMAGMYASVGRIGAANQLAMHNYFRAYMP